MNTGDQRDGSVIKKRRLILVFAFCLAACQPGTTVTDSSPGVASEAITPSLLIPSPIYTATAPDATGTPAPTETIPAPEPVVRFNVCSPLEDVTIPELYDLVKNPFAAPRPGLDDGHHGADFAYYSIKGHPQMQGTRVFTVLGGVVAAVLPDQRPYGHAVMIETPVDQLPGGFLDSLGLIQQPTPQPANIRLTCPDTGFSNELQNDEQSLYLLYAHLNTDPPVSVEQSVTCGEEIGQVGTSGASINPHLHLEIRLGPAGARFTSLFHYDNRATPAQMDAYCTWRVRGAFQMFDPLILLHVGKTYAP